MSTLYIRTPNDSPHREHDWRPGVSACDRSLLNAVKITELQALKFLRDQRCSTCFPNWGTHLGSLHRRAA